MRARFFARVPLRVRVAAWVAGATAVLGVVALVVAFIAVRSAMRAELQDALRRDARTLAAAYDGAEGGTGLAPHAATGRVRVQLYGPDGTLFAASDPADEAPSAALPADVVQGAPADWRGRRQGRALQAATAPFSRGVVAVSVDTGYIGAALATVARALGLTAAALLLVALPVGWFVARAGTGPIRRLSEAASRLGPEDLDPLQIEVPPDEVGRLAEALDALLVRVRDARDAQRAFLAETSHELRTPLTSLRGFLRRARRRASPEVASDLDDAERIAAGMARLVEDLLELSRGRLVREITPHLVEVGQEVVAPVAAEFPAVSVRPGPASTVLGEPERLRQALRNLVANAERAAGSSGRVTVAWTLGGGRVHLEVRDDGPGLSPEVEARLFEPFAPGPGGGSGLGLAIAKRLVEAHGGTIAVDRREGETVFEMCFPALDEDEESA